MATRLGIDIGGTGIKGAPVDTTTGELIADRFRILTPHPATPDAVAARRRRGREALRLDRADRRDLPGGRQGRRRADRGERRQVVDRRRRRRALFAEATGGARDGAQRRRRGRHGRDGVRRRQGTRRTP